MDSSIDEDIAICFSPKNLEFNMARDEVVEPSFTFPVTVSGDSAHPPLTKDVRVGFSCPRVASFRISQYTFYPAHLIG